MHSANQRKYIFEKEQKKPEKGKRAPLFNDDGRNRTGEGGGAAGNIYRVWSVSVVAKIHYAFRKGVINILDALT